MLTHSVLPQPIFFILLKLVPMAGVSTVQILNIILLFFLRAKKQELRESFSFEIYLNLWNDHAFNMVYELIPPVVGVS